MRELLEIEGASCGLRKVIIQSGNPYTVREIKRAGVEVIEYDFSAFKKGGTGFTCALCLYFERAGGERTWT